MEEAGSEGGAAVVEGGVESAEGWFLLLGVVERSPMGLWEVVVVPSSVARREEGYGGERRGRAVALAGSGYPSSEADYPYYYYYYYQRVARRSVCW